MSNGSMRTNIEPSVGQEQSERQNHRNNNSSTKISAVAYLPPLACSQWMESTRTDGASVCRAPERSGRLWQLLPGLGHHLAHAATG